MAIERRCELSRFRIHIAGATLLVFAAAVVATVLHLAQPADAQLDPGNFDLIQRGTKVGEVYVPPREPGQTTYIEHWVLFPNYTYPSPVSRQGLRLVALRRPRYTSEEDFFRNVPWGEGYRYVQITANESTSLPVR